MWWQAQSSTLPEDPASPQLQHQAGKRYDVSMQQFSEYLRRQGLVSHAQLETAQAKLETLNLKTGLCGLAFGFLEEPQIRRILTIQRRTGDRFGEIALARGWLTRDQLDTILRIQEKYRITLTDVLVMEGMLTRDQLAEEERLFMTSGGK